MDPSKPRRKRRKRDFIAPGLALVAIAVVVLSGWWKRHEVPPPKMMDAATLKKELSAVIPTGMAFNKAWDILTGRGFDCVAVPPSAFVEVRPVICTRKDDVPGQAKQVMWQVILKDDHKDGTVTDIIVVKH